MLRGIQFDTRVRLDLLAQTLALLVYAFFGIHVFGFLRVPHAFWVATLTPVTVELLLSAVLDRKLRIPLGPLIAGLSLYLLIESRSYVPYLLAGAIAPLSKRFLRSEGKQIFNPSNIALLTVIYLMPWSVASSPGQWHSELWMVITIYSVGTFVSTLAKRKFAPFAYFTAFLAVSFFRSWLTGIPPFLLAGTVLGVPQGLMAFHMMTDPQTCPAETREQIAFGLAIGLFDAFFRWYIVLNAPFVALVVVTAAWPLVRVGIGNRWTSPALA